MQVRKESQGTSSDVAIRRAGKLSMLCSFHTTHAVFGGGVRLCPRAPTACLCLSLQGQQTSFLNAVIGNSIIH